MRVKSLVSTDLVSSAMASTEPPLKKQKLSLTLKKEAPTAAGGRFASTAKDKTYNEAAKGVVPANMKQCNSWALRTFNAWAAGRAEREQSDHVPSDILKSHDTEVVCKYMQYILCSKVREKTESLTPWDDSESS